MKGKRRCGFGRGHADAPARAIERCWATDRKPILGGDPGCPSREILRRRCRWRTWRSCESATAGECEWLRGDRRLPCPGVRRWMRLRVSSPRRPTTGLVFRSGSERWTRSGRGLASIRSRSPRLIPNGVIAVVRTSGRGKGSGMAIDQTLTHLWTLRDGKAIQFDGYSTKQEALEAAGLRE